MRFGCLFKGPHLVHLEDMDINAEVLCFIKVRHFICPPGSEKYALCRLHGV